MQEGKDRKRKRGRDVTGRRIAIDKLRQLHNIVHRGSSQWLCVKNSLADSKATWPGEKRWLNLAHGRCVNRRVSGENELRCSHNRQRGPAIRGLSEFDDFHQTNNPIPQTYILSTRSWNILRHCTPRRKKLRRG